MPITMERRSEPAAVEGESFRMATRFGNVLVVHDGEAILSLRFLSEAPDADPQGNHAGPPWWERLRSALDAYFQGQPVTFADFPVDLSQQPPFRRRVLEECRRIPYGQTLTYTELAARAGKPLAVRAVGSAMSHNPVALLIPCHRVSRSDGSLGGYSAPGGIDLKRQLLELERVPVS